MHEVSIMYEILTVVKQHAETEKISEIQKIKLVVGEHALIVPDALRFAFDMLKQPPVAERAVLELETRTGRDFFIEYMEGE